MPFEEKQFRIRETILALSAPTILDIRCNSETRWHEIQIEAELDTGYHTKSLV